MTQFKICVHNRDWVAGGGITDQIAQSVAESCRTIVVLSPNFIRSDWAIMEFRLAHLKALADNRVRLIVIKHGDIGTNNDETEKLAPEIKAYLSTNTYVEWNDPMLFDKLRYALPHHSDRASRINENSNEHIPMAHLS